jgi:hypothetical protein
LRVADPEASKRITVRHLLKPSQRNPHIGWNELRVPNRHGRRCAGA